jgi:peroxin-6
VEEEDFVKAKRELVPSVSKEELEHYERVRKVFEGGEQRRNEEQGNMRRRAMATEEKDGSRNGKGTALQVPNSGKSKTAALKGSGKGKAGMDNNGRRYDDEDEEGATPYQTSYEDGNDSNKSDSDEDDYIIGKESNGTLKSASSGKGRQGAGKEKAIVGFGNDSGDEQLYQ